MDNLPVAVRSVPDEHAGPRSPGGGIVLLQDADFFVDFLSEEGPKGKMIGSFFCSET